MDSPGKGDARNGSATLRKGEGELGVAGPYLFWEERELGDMGICDRATLIPVSKYTNLILSRI